MQRLLRNRTVPAILVIIGLACLAAAWPAYRLVQRINAAKTLYLGFVEAMYSNQAIRVNFLPSREHTYPFAAHKSLTVAIDDEIDPAYLARVKSAFSTMAGFMGSNVTFRMVGTEFNFRDDFYVYVGYKKDTYAFRPSFIADFTKKLHRAVSSRYANTADRLLWDRFPGSSIGRVYGTGFLFNNAYSEIDYNSLVKSDKIIRDKSPAIVINSVIATDEDVKVKNPNPESAVIYVSTRNSENVDLVKFDNFINSAIVEESYQILVQQNDLNIEQFRNKSILFDGDTEIFTQPSLDEYIEISASHAAQGLCLLDAMYLLHLGSIDAENFRWRLLKSSWFTYAKLYLNAYRRYREGPPELFDPRCW